MIAQDMKVRTIQRLVLLFLSNTTECYMGEDLIGVVNAIPSL